MLKKQVYIDDSFQGQINKGEVVLFSDQRSELLQTYQIGNLYNYILMV